MTRYVVLRKDDAPGVTAYHREGPSVDAVSAEAAVRKAVDGLEGSATFVAVPLRSFQELTVTVETKKTVKVG